MIKSATIIVILCSWSLLNAQTSGLTNVQNHARMSFQSVDMGGTEWTAGLMKGIWDRNCSVTIPYLWQRYNSATMAGYRLNFERVANGETGGYLNGGITFSDGDFFKWMEAVCYVIALDPSSGWDATLDDIITDISAAQDRAVNELGPEFDGYVSTKDQLEGTSYVGGGQVYNFGHLMSTAAIHHRVTGKETMLNAAKRTGLFLWDTMQAYINQPWNYWDHTTIMGSVELFRETGDENIFNISNFIINTKGDWNGKQLNTQANGKLIDQTIAVGHAQRANYLYAGAVDAYMEGADTGYIALGKTIWEDIIAKRMYITGGVGSIHGFDPSCDHWTPQYPNPPYEPTAASCNLYVTEGYGPDYYLPNEGAYCEGCAQCGMALFCWRMLQATGEAKYADLLETELFNGILGGISMEGDKFYYTNKLERLTNDIYQMDAPQRTGSTSPEPYENANRANYTQCCPPNYARLLAMTPNMAYGINDTDKQVWVHLYGSNRIQTEFPDGTTVNIEQTADDFPWLGNVSFTINTGGNYGLKLRIPSWSENTSVAIDGVPVGDIIQPGTYYTIENRNWAVGSTLELALEVKVQIVKGNPLTGDAQTDKIAITRGPLVYCAERVDNPESETGYTFKEFGIDSAQEFSTVYNEALDVMALSSDQAYLIPYYAWSNRADNYMKVWLNDLNVTSSDNRITDLFQNDNRQFNMSCYPNPFDNMMHIDIHASGITGVSIQVTDLYGRIVNQLFEGALAPDINTFHWNGKSDAGYDLPNGMYVILLKSKDENGILLQREMIVKN